MTEPGSTTDATDADRAEQAALLDPPSAGTAGEATSPAADVPEADALEQQLAARPGEAGAPRGPIGNVDANEADVLEQQADVPVDDDDVLT